MRFVISLKKHFLFPIQEISRKIHHQFFKQNGLLGVFNLFGDSPAMEWLLFQKMEVSSYQEALQRLSSKHFSIYRMTGLYQMAFGQRLYKVKQWIEKQIEQGSPCTQ